MRALSSRNPKAGSAAGSPRPPRAASGARYDVLDRVGEGTLFVVYRVREKSNNRLLALKALKNNFNAHPQFAPALAQALADSTVLSHPLLARVEEVGREDGTLFLLQEWLPGQSLEARLRRAPFGRIETISSTRQIAEALQYLHENGAVHGDLRPRQIISSGDGQLKLTDGGLSQSFHAANLSPSDVLQDAVGYTAPELSVATGRQAAPATPQSDLYALGVILYRMLAGRAPFDGPTPVAVAMRHRNDSPLPPSRFNPHCPPDLEAIALALLQKKPEARISSAAELLQLLNTASANTTSAASVSATLLAADSAVSALTMPLPNDTSLNNSSAASNALNEDATNDETTISADDSDLSSTRSAPVTTQNAMDDSVNGAALFPTTMPISKIANAPLSALTATAAATTTTATANVAVAANPATSAALAAAATSSAVVSTAGTSSVSALPTLPATEEDLAADAILERKAIKKHRRREALGAFLAFFWIWVAVGLLGGIVYGSYNWWVKQTPRDVIVPAYLGKNEADAKTILEKAGLKFNEVGEVYDTKRAAGTVLRGFPPAGKIVKPGRQIDVTVSRGPEQVEMRDLSDLDLVHARRILQKAGMRLGNISTIYHDTIARGYICGQYPQPGDMFNRSEPINLVISRGPQPPATANAASAATATPAPNTNNSDIAPADESSNLQNPPISSQAAPNNTTDPSAPTASDTEPMVSRTVRISIPVPKKADTTTREVRVVVRDADGEHIVYDENHAPGEQITEDIQITRAQGGSATILIYIDGSLQKQQRV